jgi:TonB-linked SusC/RagA family outer membrane protein
MKKTLLIVICQLLIGLSAMAQPGTRVVSGVVRDAAGEPFVGASVVVKGATTAVLSDAEGRFSIRVPEGATLEVSFMGYAKETVRVGAGSHYDVVLQPTAHQLEEVVFVGYGVRDRRALTSSLARVENTAIKDLKVQTMEQLLKGQAAGVVVSQTNGHPGAATTIRVRGIGSINASNDPLYVVDGMPIEHPGATRDFNMLSFLNPSDIETITILKDAASTAIYGSRASNGVVLITTKQGAVGKTTVDVNVYYGLQVVPQHGRFEMMNGQEYAQYNIERWVDKQNYDPDPKKYPAGRHVTGIDDMNAVEKGIYKGVINFIESGAEGENWFNNVLQVAPTQQYNISLTTGAEKARLFVSADYQKTDGVVKTSDYSRLSLRVNADAEPYSFLKLGLRVNPSYNMRNQIYAEGDFMNMVYLASPLSPAYLEDGTLNPSLGNEFHGKEFEEGLGNWAYANPYKVLDEVENMRNDFRMLSSMNIDLKLFDGLYLKNSVGVDLNFARWRLFKPHTVGTSLNDGGDKGTVVASDKTTSRGEAGRDEFMTFLVENYLSYNKTFGGHTVEAVLGHSAQKQDYNSIGVSATKFADAKIPYVAAGTPGDYRDGSDGSDMFKYALESYFGRASYSYDNRYFATASLRRDGSSRFSPVGRWGWFPSLSAGWDVSGEEFFKNAVPFINTLKLRASWGITGNINTGSSFAYYPSMYGADYTFNNTLATGRYPGYVDQALTWEKSNEYDFGLDIAVLNRRLSLTVDYYNRRTYDLLLDRGTPEVLGTGSVLTNIGEIENKGWEFSLNATNFDTRDFRWTTGFNLTFNRNKVLAMNSFGDPVIRGDEFNCSGVTEVGQPISMFKGWVVLGVYRDDAEAQADIDANINKDAYAGSMKIKGTNADGVIDNEDREIIGNPHPDFVFGITNTVTYKGFDLNVLMNGTVGNDVVLDQYQFILNFDNPFNVAAMAKDRWRSPEQPGNGWLPTTVNKNNQRKFVRMGNSTWVKDASHLTIGNITLGYTLPEPVLKKLKAFRSFRVYASIQNAWTFSAFPLNNPDGTAGEGTNGSDLFIGKQYMLYPLARTFTVGANIGF